MQQIHKRCCGLDLHKKTVVACLITPTPDGTGRRETRTFRTVTQELLQLADWLTANGCTHVAMEATGVDFQPVYNLLEGHFELLVVNAQHIKAVPGRKTDVKDAEWIADLLQHGLLKASFIPDAEQRELRDLTRYRTVLIEERARTVNRLQKTLEDTNLKLSSVVSDITGVSARAILNMLLIGESDPKALARLARGRLKAKQAELEEALVGTIKPHHQFMLKEHLGHLDELDQAITRVGREIAGRMALPAEFETTETATSPLPPEELDASPFEQGLSAAESSQALAQPVPLRLLSPLAEDPATDQGELPEGPAPLPPRTKAKAVSLLVTIPGIGQRAAEGILAEIGLDMSRFQNAKRLASWAGMCPGNHESAGKRMSGKTTKGSPWLRRLLVQAAHAASHTRDTYLSAQYRRLAARIGKKKALIAVGHTILTIIFHVLNEQKPYQELGSTYFDERERQALEKRLVNRLEKLGYEVNRLPQATAA